MLNAKSLRPLALSFVFTAAASSARAANQQLINWGLSTSSSINSSLKVPGTSLFAETATSSGQHTGGDSGFSFIWPASTQFRLENAEVRLDPATYTSQLRQFSDQLQNRYWSASGGYRAGVSSNEIRYYDDNAHMAVALTQAYDITHDPVYLNRAIATYNFVISGEDSAGGGGIYFSEADHSFKDSAATLQGTRAALMLYQDTHDAKYLTDATRLYTWAKNTTQQSNGLFMEKLYLTGPKAGTVGDFTLVNFAGFGIQDNLEFYDATGNKAYLSEAQRIAQSSLSHYINPSTKAINDEGFWSFELVNALDDLYTHDRNPLWLQSATDALTWLHNNRQDPSGHYDTLWGRGGLQTTTLTSWDLNDMAPVAESYLYTGLVPEPSSAMMLLVCVLPLLSRRRTHTAGQL